jgi:hypothetical protein
MNNGNGQSATTGKEPVERVMDLFVHTPIGLAVMAWKRVPEFVGSVPDLVGQALSKGCAQLAEAEERVSEEVRKARMIGQVAVTFGGRQLRREVDARLRDAKQAAGGVATFLPGAGADGRSNGAGAPGRPTVTTTETPAEPASAPVRAAKATKAPAAKAPAAKASAAKAKAPTRATKAAPTRAAKTSASRATKAPAAPASAVDLPIREYDGLSASQVVSRLTGLSPEELRAVRSYEEASRGRRTVLVAIDRLLG